MSPGPGIVGVVAWKPFPTNLPLVKRWRGLGIRAELLTPTDALLRLRPGDTALVRLDVTPTLDDIEPGLTDIIALQHRGVRLLNRPSTLLAAHDKRETARRLGRAGIPHPWTLHRNRLDEVATVDPPFVLKPRFGSWGADVMVCRDAEERTRCLATIRDRSWFRRHGVLIQELVPPVGYDLRLIVAGGRVVGAERRVAAACEWRTNEALGARAVQARPSKEESALAIGATRAVGGDLVGVDLLPLPGGGYIVIEVNAAVDFNDEESLPGRDVFVDAADALALAVDVAA